MEQMTFFSEPAEEEKPEVQQARPVLDDDLGPGPVPCESRCRQTATYRVNMSHLVYEKHARRWMDVSDDGKVPVALYCPDGFKAVRIDGRVEHRALGDFQRVQTCSDRRCNNIFTIYGYGPGEPTLCPECLNEVWEQYKAERGS